MFEDYFRTSQEAGSLYRVEDLLGVVRTGESVEDLRRLLKPMGRHNCRYWKPHQMTWVSQRHFYFNKSENAN